MNEINKITSLYDHLKNTPKKLKIVCDWDEVIQAHEPYALWKSVKDVEYYWGDREYIEFIDWFNEFWAKKSYPTCPINYSSYGSRLISSKEGEESRKMGKGDASVVPSLIKRQTQIKNSPDFYQEAPFLTIAEDLLKLIRADKVDHIIFLTAYDKRKFPSKNRDERKYKIFKETFGNDNLDDKAFCQIELIPFDSEEKGRTKADWIKENASDFDIVIDDNPNICKEVLKLNQEYYEEREGAEEDIAELLNEKGMLCEFCEKWPVKREELAGFNHGNAIPTEPSRAICSNCWKAKRDYIKKEMESKYSEICSLEDYLDLKIGGFYRLNEIKVITPYYPAIENQHNSEVLLVKTSVSDLTKEDFK